MHETSDVLLYYNIFIYQVLCTLIYCRRRLHSFLLVMSGILVITLAYNVISGVRGWSGSWWGRGAGSGEPGFAGFGHHFHQTIIHYFQVVSWYRLLHSLSPVVIGLSVVSEAWPPVGCVIGWCICRLGDSLQAMHYGLTWTEEIYTVSIYTDSPLVTAPTQAICLPLGLCKGDC